MEPAGLTGAASAGSAAAAPAGSQISPRGSPSMPRWICSPPAVSSAAAPAGLLLSDNMAGDAAVDLLSSMSASPLMAGSVPSSSTDAAMDVTASVAALSLEERFSILRSIAEECIEEDELVSLLQANPNPICYDGFEPSGRMHIAQGVVKAININKMVSTGCKVKILIADWFAMLNKKLGGDLDAIRTVGRYMVEVWKALGVNVDSVEFLWSSEEIFNRPNEYWPLVMDIALKRSINRIVRCCQIMGRSERDDLTAAQFLYPLMQCADVFFLKVDICQLGMDQRKVNMLAREYSELAGKSKPIILSHHMLPGLKEGQEKMSKSDPSSAIFMEDDEAQINSKIKKAFCPLNCVEGNPCLEYIKYIVLPWFGSFEVHRKEANGGNK